MTTSEDFFIKICNSNFIVRVRKGLLRVLLWEGVGDRTETAIYWPPLLWSSVLCLSRSPGLLNRRPRGPALCWMMAFFTASYHQLLWTPTHRGPRGPLQPGVAFPTTTRLCNSNWSDFLSWLSYIIVQRPLNRPLNPWKGGNNCHAVHRSLSSDASVYECTMGFFFTLSHFISQIPPTRFLSITGHWDVSLPSGASLWNSILFARVEGQNTTIRW